MASEKPKEWEVRVHGQQTEEPDTDLITQIVVMFGRQLSDEAANSGEEKTGSPGATDPAIQQ